VRVANTHAPLLGRVDQENAAERPECLTAERLLGLLIDNDDFPAGIDQFGGGYQAGESGSNDDRVGVVTHARASSAGAR
jgi:hypothetical protein